MVVVAQLVESLTVNQEGAGSNPVDYPRETFYHNWNKETLR